MIRTRPIREETSEDKIISLTKQLAEIEYAYTRLQIRHSMILDALIKLEKKYEKSEM